MVLGRHDETMSTDAIQAGWYVENVYIVDNRITNSSGSGIRVERSKNVHVIGNTIDNVGRDGITFYNNATDGGCIGNSVSNWGKIPDFGYLRTEKGKIYNPKEYHARPPAGLGLPDHPAGSPSWEENRYYLRGRDTSVIPEYDPNNYKDLHAFRGFSGISVTQASQGITIAGNRIKGNTSRTNGLYNYASNYGINIGTHDVNPPVPSNGNCIIFNNVIEDCIDYALYCPQYVDRTAKKGTALESVVFGNVCDPRKIDFFYRKTGDAVKREK
jgi:hypothetical protein